MRSRISPSVLILLATFASACRSAPRPSPEAGKAEAPKSETGIPDSVHLTSAAMAEAGISTWKVQAVDLEHLLALNGNVSYDENRLLQVAANVQGRVASIPVDLGTRVSKGDALIVVLSIDLGRAREELTREIFTFHVASRAYERAKSLVAAKAISAGEFQTREADYLTKQAAVAAAERALRLYGDSAEAIARQREGLSNHEANPSETEAASLTLRAPFAGRVIDRRVTPGSLFEAMQPLLTLADLSSVWVFLQAYEKDLALLKHGLSVTLRTEAYPQESFRGRVDFLGSVVDASTRTVKVRATVENPRERLRPGMFVKAQVDVPRPQAEPHPVLAVPQSALQTLEGRSSVFVQKEPGVFVRRIVETGHTFEGFTEVLSGVKPNDLIVTEGSFVLKSEFARASLVEEE